ncbi:Protein ALTERED XYLOGLUCAN 9 [Linum grandiflorum]
MIANQSTSSRKPKLAKSSALSNAGDPGDLKGNPAFSAMFGGIQLGLFLACIVLFVPMVMAGWHLSRNKMLFFSGALFISLAVCVHLTPYFPSVSDFVTSVQSVVVFDNRDDSCINSVHDVVWDVKPRRQQEEEESSSSSPVVYDMNWNWSNARKVNECQFQKLGQSDISDLLNGSWIVVAGDSQSRLVVQSFLSLVLDSEKMESIKGELFRRHSDYAIVVEEIGMKLDFFWAPYVVNLTDMMMEFKQNRTYPDVLVMGAGLWDMLHVTNASRYSVDLKSLVSLLPNSLVRSPHLFWLPLPTLINGMLNTEEKKEKMSDEMLHAYDKSLRGSRVLRRYGGPVQLLDIQSLSWNCGPRCTVDGMHYDGAVYEAAVQILLNALLIESHQKLGPA